MGMQQGCSGCLISFRCSASNLQTWLLFKILRLRPGVQLLTIRQLKGYMVYFPSRMDAGLDVRVGHLQTSLILLWEKDDLEELHPHSPRLSAL